MVKQALHGFSIGLEHIPTPILAEFAERVGAVRLLLEERRPLADVVTPGGHVLKEPRDVDQDIRERCGLIELQAETGGGCSCSARVCRGEPALLQPGLCGLEDGSRRVGATMLRSKDGLVC